VIGCAFESGNVGQVTRLNALEYDIGIRGDTLNPRYRVWYYFSVSNMAVGQKVLLNLTGFSKSKSLYRDGMTPVVRSTSRSQWERLPERHVYYYRSPRHEGSYVLSFAFLFDKAETYYFAYCFPYTYLALQRELHRLDTLGLSCYRRECLCRTLEHRRCAHARVCHAASQKAWRVWVASNRESDRAPLSAQSAPLAAARECAGWTF
jgi:hypothetical protein